MAKRFDRWIASPEAIALPQAFDEFLSQEELPCLIDGCGWVGRQLGNHVNFTHGITAEEFKRAAGFNKTTGLVTPAVSQALSERPHLHEAIGDARQAALDKGRQAPPPVRHYYSLEAREHQLKARALIAGGPSTRPPQVCIACGAEFQPGPAAVAALYCSVECRTHWYQDNRAALKFWMQCFKCGKDFQGSIYQQQKRVEHGLPVFCCVHCRQLHNSSFKRPGHREKESLR